MKKITVNYYVCEHCGVRNESEEWMTLHEQVCEKNPANLPCIQCAYMILGYGCLYGINCDNVGGKVLCIKYTKGKPQLPPSEIILQGNPIEFNSNNNNNDENE